MTQAHDEVRPDIEIMDAMIQHIPVGMMPADCCALLGALTATVLLHMAKNDQQKAMSALAITARYCVKVIEVNSQGDAGVH